MPNWTPGPWALQSLIDPYALAIVTDSEPGFSTRPLSKKLIAEFPMLRPPAEVQANATLAATSPELYAALEALILGEEPWGALETQGRAALLKANPAKWGRGASTTPEPGTEAATGSKEDGGGQ